MPGRDDFRYDEERYDDARYGQPVDGPRYWIDDPQMRDDMEARRQAWGSVSYGYPSPGPVDPEKQARSDKINRMRADMRAAFELTGDPVYARRTPDEVLEMDWVRNALGEEWRPPSGIQIGRWRREDRSNRARMVERMRTEGQDVDDNGFPIDRTAPPPMDLSQIDLSGFQRTPEPVFDAPEYGEPSRLSRVSDFLARTWLGQKDR